MANPYLGEIRIFPYNFVPTGWAACDGSLYPISQNTALFSLLGTTYGGDGISNFALPDMRSRVPVGYGQGPGLSPYGYGQQGGVENVTLLTNNLPAHNHTINAVTSGGNQASPANALPAVESTGTSQNYSTAATNTTMAPTTVGYTGSNQPFTNIQPYLALTFCIATQGIFPSRS